MRSACFIALLVGLALAACAAPQSHTTTPTAVDTDHDGIDDAHDACPASPEDCDGHLDDDGCPDPDNDGDGILDVCDQCPNDPETWNGVDDTDGCPDNRLVIIRSDIRIMPHVQFAEGSAQIDPSSNALLDDIAHAMVANPQIERVLIRGNASLGEHDPERLSERRAQAVRDALVARGVASSRFEIRGDGATRPIAPNITAHGRELNRRADFEIVQTAFQPASSPPPPRTAPSPPNPPSCPGQLSPPAAPLPPPGGCPRSTSPSPRGD